MVKLTAYQQFIQLCQTHGRPVSAEQLTKQGVGYASTVLNQFVRQGRVIKYGPNGPMATFYPKDMALAMQPDTDLDRALDDVFSPTAITAFTSAPTLDSLDMLVEQMADRLAARIAAQVQVRLLDYLRQVGDDDDLTPQPVVPEPDRTPLTITKVKGSRLNVCIAGLLPQQAQIIEREFGKDMQLAFIGSNSSPKEARGKLDHADAALLMTKFVGHWLDKIFATAEVPVFRRVTGGMSMLRDNLTSLYCST